jgi:uncharacterized cupredoxin-like copper-binding protein
MYAIEGLASIVHWTSQMNYVWKKEGSVKQLRAFIFCLLLLTLASLLGACGESTGGSSSTTATHSTTAPQEVKVVMGEMYFKPSITTFKVGQPYKFVLVNEGKAVHEFVITPTRKPGEDHEDVDKVAILHADELSSGQNTTIDFTFKQPAPAGTLEFECNYPGHYEKGMRMPIVVEK